MKRQVPAPYIVWVNNTAFRHRTIQAAQRRAERAEQKGQHVVITTTALRHTVFSLARQAN